jgi:pimeloyl-ACP methyl ester carboxylesterase
VASLAFFGSPLGVPTPIKSDMDHALANGHTPLVVRTLADFEERNSWLAPKMPFVPWPILYSWMSDEVSTADHNAQVWDVVHDSSFAPTLLDLAPDLFMPTLVIWCHPDRIFHVSGAPILDEALPTSSLAMLEDCGHLPMLDQPSEVAEQYDRFLQNEDVRRAISSLF